MQFSENEQISYVMVDIKYKNGKVNVFCVGEISKINALKTYLDIHNGDVDFVKFMERCEFHKLNYSVEAHGLQKMISGVINKKMKKENRYVSDEDIDILTFCSSPDNTAKLLGLSEKEKEEIIAELKECGLWEITREMRKMNCGME